MMIMNERKKEGSKISNENQLFPVLLFRVIKEGESDREKRRGEEEEEVEVVVSDYIWYEVRTYS